MANFATMAEQGPIEGPRVLRLRVPEPNSRYPLLYLYATTIPMAAGNKVPACVT